MTHQHPNPLQKSQINIVKLLVKLMENPSATVTDEELKLCKNCGWAFVVADKPEKGEYLNRLYDRAFNLKHVLEKLVKEVHLKAPHINTAPAELVLSLIDKQGIEFVDDGFVPNDPNGFETIRQ